ncbi:hypothetical protein D1007_60491 [Hordeum vulgare]|nr:hypothetical protein D1007_60491 [Hordeum vulgare]
MACVKATEASADLGVHRVWLESDCQVLVNALHSDEYQQEMVGVLLRETLHSVCAMQTLSHLISAFVIAPDFVSVLVASDIAARVYVWNEMFQTSWADDVVYLPGENGGLSTENGLQNRRRNDKLKAMEEHNSGQGEQSNLNKYFL